MLSLKSKYRTHTCGELKASNVGETVTLSGWVHRKRDHGSLLFIDLRDNYGMTQIVFDGGDEALERVRPESVIQITGTVVARDAAAINDKIPTGHIEVQATSFQVLTNADVLPFQVFGDDGAVAEDLRLKYRYVDLRRDSLHKNILTRNRVMKFLRDKMWDMGFSEFQTPILTVSSPEGARDYIVPSRHHHGMFYALPQAPQQFKQLLQIAGFDRYFQIAPCFRDEDLRADRLLEFYQLDLEMSFVDLKDIQAVGNELIPALIREFVPDAKIADEIPHIPYDDAMLKYGCDKPDLRNPLVLQDASSLFGDSGFGVYDGMVKEGKMVKGMLVKGIAEKPRSFFDKLDGYAKEEGMGGMAYIAFASAGAKGIAKLLSEAKLNEIKAAFNAEDGDAVLFVVGKGVKFDKFSGRLRNKVGEELGLVDKNSFRMCWIVDFPFYEENEETGAVEFSHNPFSMPQGGMDSLLNKNPLDILAYQYDFVCNGVELLSGGVRNHSPEVMYKVFELAGYGKEVVENKFGGMLNAFKFGAPPHAGSAYGVDRLIMLLLDEEIIRDVIAFPLNGKAQDLMMQAPNFVTQQQLDELHIKPVPVEDKK